jgi:hypothetical protein
MADMIDRDGFRANVGIVIMTMAGCHRSPHRCKGGCSFPRAACGE